MAGFCSFYAQPALADEPIINFTEIGEWITTNSLTLAQWVTENLNAVLTQQAIGSAGTGTILAVQTNAKQVTENASGNANAIIKNASGLAAGQVSAQAAADAAIAPQSTMCLIPQAMQSRHAAEDAAKGAIRAFAGIGAAKDTGPGANANTDSAAAEDVCSIAYFLPADQQAKVNCSNINGSVSGRYVNANWMVSSVTTPLQYPIPGGLATSSDNHIIFSNVTPQPDSPYKDPVRFIAAWKFCESLRPKFTGHVVTGTLKSADIVAINEQQAKGARASDAFDTCVSEIAYRTACPKLLAGSFAPDSGPNGGGSSKSCFQIQKEMCYTLKAAVPTTDDDASSKSVGKGLGIDTIGDPEADAALDSCDDNGLSLAMFDKIMANMCTNYKAVANKANNNGNSGSVESEQAKCHELTQSFDQSIQQRADRLAALAAQLEGSNARSRERGDTP